MGNGIGPHKRSTSQDATALSRRDGGAKVHTRGGSPKTQRRDGACDQFSAAIRQGSADRDRGEGKR